MYFVSFPVSTTNIFPLANSDCGGQLMSEYNLRSRESVATDPTIEYSVGPSYVHSENSFKISALNSTTIQISDGRAIVNGHYIESITPITIDLAAVNYKAGLSDVSPLKGDLAIGLVMMYSTYETLAASALPENSDGYYEGIRVVIVPESSVKRPIDVPYESQKQEVNMHLLLGTFTFYNGTISNVQQDNDKLKVFDASRIGNIGSSLSDIYLSKRGLDPNKLYVFAGKTSDGENIDGRDTWCEADDSLMIWDDNPRLTTTKPSATVAHFEYDASGNGTTKLVLPHKQVDGAVNQHNQPVYFPDKSYALPNATFAEGSGGVVNSAYTGRIKHIEQTTNDFYHLSSGKMRAFVDVLAYDPDDSSKYEEGKELPEIPVISELSDSESAVKVSDARVQLNGVKSGVGAAASCITQIVGMLNLLPEEIQTALSTILTRSASDLHDVRSDIDVYLNNYLPLLIDSSESSVYINAATQIKDGIMDDASTCRELYYIWMDIIADLAGNTDENVRTAVGYFRTAVRNVGTAIPGCYNVYEIMDELIAYRRTKDSEGEGIVYSETWNPGDYVLVREDQTQGTTVSGRYPSTIYVVNLPKIYTIAYVDKLTTKLNPASRSYEYQLNLWKHTVLKSLAKGVQLDSLTFEYTDENPIPDPPDVSFFLNNSQRQIDCTQYRGVVNTDYFVIFVYNRVSDTVENWTSYFYTPDIVSAELDYIKKPIYVTGEIGLATTETVGGFLAVPNDSDHIGQGYVTIDEDGNLRVLDFNLLLLGVQAQQLGQDLSIGSGMDIAKIQEDIDQYVNDRICYPNANQIKYVDEYNDEYPNDPKDAHVINLTIELPSTTDVSTITISDIGSRANSYLYVHLTGSATSALTVAFNNCEKLRVDSTIIGEPNLVFNNCNLYYDSNVLSRAHAVSGNGTGINNLTLWYEQDIYADGTPKNGSPNLQVDGMTVTLVDNISSAVNIEQWDTQNPNDNHYAYGLRGLTFAGDGTITGMSLLVADRSTTNIDLGTSMFRSAFTIPQGQGLSYPENKLRHQLKVTGNFVTCYWSTTYNKFVVKETEFSALSQYYSSNTLQPGSIGFLTKSSLQSHVTGVADNTDTIDCWDLNQMNIFFGGAIN